jgi:CBS domain-containing protein
MSAALFYLQKVIVSDDFPFASAPFNELTATERTLLQELAATARHRPGEAILLPHTDHPQFLGVVHSGHVQLEDMGRVHILGAGESFNWRGVLSGHNQATVTALDEVQLWRLPKETLTQLLAGNARFSAKVFGAVASHLADDEGMDQHRELLSLMLVRVRDAYLQKPFYVDGQLDLVSVCRLLSGHKTGNALVRDEKNGIERVGMFTTTDLRDALLHPTPPAQLAVRDVARFDLVTIGPEAELFDALLLMLRHRVHRVLVKEGDAIVGVLSQLDLMSFMSNHSHLITLQVEQAKNVAELQVAALQVDDTIKMLQRGGTRVEIISRLVSELNSQIFARLWALLAPPELARNSCLLVLGSEGRSEQILKTDQDNALLLRDGYQHPQLEDITREFSAALLGFGYPPCPGNIMVTNPMWCQNLGPFRQTIGQWLHGTDPQGPMNLAIFMDARAVAGDAALLLNARDFALAMAIGSDTFISRLASAIDQFQEPGSAWWNRLHLLQSREAETFDLKKIGSFPIVHGTRALALEYRLAELGTVERLQALASLQILPAALARDLVETLRMLMTLKLRNNLRQRALGQAISNLVELSSLGTLERDQLTDALGIIRQFKQFLRRHYHLE